MNETTTFNWSPQLRPSRALIQLDIDADRIARSYPVDVPLVGDARSVLVELLYHVHRKIREGARPMSTWRQWSSIPTFDKRYDQAEHRSGESVPLRPERWRAELFDVLPSDCVIFSDIGGHMLFNIHHLCIRAKQRFVINLGFGSMGHGTIAPIGAAMSGVSAPIVAIIGDACFCMNGLDLLVAVERRLPIVWIVENNGGHGVTWHASKALSGGEALSSALCAVEVASIARAMGLQTTVVDRPNQIAAALQAALAHNGPSLIEVRVDPDAAPPLGERANTLAGFIRK